MTTENISTLKINKLTQEQFDNAMASGSVQDKEIYLVPDEEVDTSNFATTEQLNGKVDNDDFTTYKNEVQASLDSKQDIISGAASTITSNNLSADKVLVSNASGKVSVSDVSTTELGHLTGVTSGIQSQLDTKATSENLTNHINNNGDDGVHFGDGEKAEFLAKIDAAKSEAVTTAAADAKTKADDALSSANTYTDGKIAALVDSAPETMDTLNELATAIKTHNDVTDALDSAIGTKANKADFESHTADKSNPHGVTKDQVGLGNVPNVATNDQTPTYDEATSLATLTNGEKLSAAFGKIKLAITNLINHMANTANPHSVTKSQVGLGNVDNTSDVNKPISDATQAALDGKASSGHSHSVATTSAKGFLSADDKAKLDGITESADSVSFSRSLTSGTQVGTININGSNTTLYAPTNTHHTSGTVVGSSASTTTNATTALTNGSVYLNHVENGTVRNSHKITGSGATSVTSDSSGNITVSSTNTTYGVATSSNLGLVKSGTDITVDSSGNVSVNDNSHGHTVANINGLQTSLDGKQSSITGGASTITSSNLTASRALVSNSSGKVAASSVTSTELGYLDGVTSNVQNQIDGKASSGHSHNVATTSTAGYMSASDKTKLNGISADADSVSFSRGLTSGETVGTITINGNSTTLYAPYNTHYVSGTVVAGSSTATSNTTSSLSNGSVYLNHVEGGSVNNSHKITGSGGTTVTSDSSGNITVSSPNTVPTHTHTISDVNNLQTNLSSINTSLGSKMSSSNPTATGYFSLNRKSGSTVGAYSTAEGYGCTASNTFSYAEGNETTSGGSSSHAEGQSTTASSQASHAEGILTTASNTASHAEGQGTTASGIYSHAEGRSTIASGECSHAEGMFSEASGPYSHAEGYSTQAIELYSHAAGYCTTANQLQYVIGQYNKTSAGSNIDSQNTSDLQALFIIGNGTSSASSNAFRVSSSGKCFGTTAFASSGADFAELFEWADGNPENEDRRGLFVKLNGEKIELANAGDDYFGIISGAQAFIGNTASEDWHGKYLTDIFGARLTQEVEIPEKVDEITGETIPAYTATQYVVNPDYDPDEEYVMRENRKEWGVVGLLGQVVVVDDGTCEVNGYCKPSEGGIATASDSGYRVMKRIDDTHIKVLVR